MAEPAEQLRMTLAEFLDWDDGTDTRYELIEGRVRSMGFASAAHGIVLANLAAEIHGSLHQGCRGLIRIGVLIPGKPDTFYVPDFGVTAARPHPHRQYVPDPILIAEIVDPDTFEHDWGRKLHEYRAIPSVRELLLVSVEERRIELFRRCGGARWLVESLIGEDWLRLETCADVILTSEIYASVPPPEPSGV
jgi:Uma2 family endonuclease